MFDSAFALDDSQMRAAQAAFRDAARMYPSQAAFAKVLGTTQQNISKLLRKGSLCPTGRVLKLEAATGIPKETLRPDIYPRDAASLANLDSGVVTDGAGVVATPSRADSADADKVRTPDSLSGLTA